MATTTNYSWTTPDDTALVKDGAAAIRTLGSSVDTTVKNLNPETTTGAISYRGATANQKVALPIGTAGQVLKVNSGATAPEWGAVAGWTTLASGSLSGTEVSLTGFTSTLTALRLEIYGAQTATATQPLLLRFNSNSGSVYESCAIYTNSTSVWTTNSATALDAFFGVENTPTIANTYDMCLTIFNYNETARKFIQMQWNQSDNPWGGYVNFNSTTAITSIQIRMNGTATFNGGTYVLRGQ